MTDEIVEIGDSCIQHGPYNDRVYLMKMSPGDSAEVVERIEKLVENHGYSKVFTKVGENMEDFLSGMGYVKEASIPGMYYGERCLFMSRFLSDERENVKPETKKRIRDVLKTAKSKKEETVGPELPQGYDIRPLSKEDMDDLARLYGRVFASYPFPIDDTGFLRDTMEDDVLYFGCFEDDELIAASSADVDRDMKCAEMTDFATLPEHRGENLSLILLEKMEDRIREEGIETAYTIARSISYGMNITFAKADYRFAGTLINNCNISGKIENMNVWFKKMDDLRISGI